MSPPIEYPSIVHMLEDAADCAPRRDALVLDDARLSYAQYRASVARFAERLIGAGARGERVAVLAGNGFEICIAIYGALAAGAQAVPLNPAYTHRELTEILRDAQPSVLAHDQHCAAQARALRETMGAATLVTLDETLWSSNTRAAVTRLPRPLPKAQDLAMLQYTGGTTGKAKGVNLSHGATAINITQREAILPTGRDGERIVCVMPLFHAYALAMGLYLAPYCRATLIIQRKYHPRDLLATIARERITIFPGSPTLYTGLLAHEQFSATDFSSLNMCYSGSAPLATDTLEQWERATGAPIYEGYGQTEAGPVLTFNPASGRRKAGSVGVALARTEIEIVDVESGRQTLSTDTVGEIRARGPQLMTGYRNLPVESAKALRDGWLYTGDLGELDADGYLFIRERLKDMAIVSGYNVYPREIEEVLFMHAEVSDAAAVGVADPYRGEVVIAYIVATDDSAELADRLRAHLARNLAKYKLPASIEFVDALPKTSVGKTDKNALRKRAHGSPTTQ